MVGHRPLDQDEIQSMMESGGLKPATLRKRQKVGEAFSKYNSENYGLDSIKTLLEGDKAHIEKSVTEFHGNSHSEEEERRWINGGASSKKGYIWQDPEWRSWKVYFRELNHSSFTYIIVLISCYYYE